MVGRLSHLLFFSPKIAGSIRPLIIQHFAPLPRVYKSTRKRLSTPAIELDQLCAFHTEYFTSKSVPTVDIKDELLA
jgi:hypothetical protein